MVLKGERLVLKSFTLKGPNGEVVNGGRSVLLVDPRYSLLGLTVESGNGAFQTLVFTPGCHFLGKFDAEGTLAVLTTDMRSREEQDAAGSQ